jgi:hypothetical protein
MGLLVRHLGRCQIKYDAQLVDTFGFGRLARYCHAPEVENELGARSISPCLLLVFLLPCFPQCSSPRRSHFLSYFPLLLQPHQGAEQQLATGSPMCVPIDELHS